MEMGWAQDKLPNKCSLIRKETSSSPIKNQLKKPNKKRNVVESLLYLIFRNQSFLYSLS
jgi:hypothetical protein